MNRIDAFVDWMDEWQQKRRQDSPLREVTGRSQDGPASRCEPSLLGDDGADSRLAKQQTCNLPPVSAPSQDFSADDNLSEQAWDDYEAAIRMSPHPECCACEDCNLKHRYEEEA